MEGKYKVVTLCGSTRFKDAFMETQKRLTLEGNIVISVGLFGLVKRYRRRHYRDQDHLCQGDRNERLRGFKI